MKPGRKKDVAPEPKPGTALIASGRIRSKYHLKRWTEQAMELTELGQGLPPMVYLPPAIRGKKPTVIEDMALSTEPTIKEQIVRINTVLDPIGMLIAAASGVPMVAWLVNRDGTVEEIVETLSLKERLSIVKFLTDRTLPRLRAGIVKHEKVTEEEDGWASKLQTAAANSDGKPRDVEEGVRVLAGKPGRVR